jgi:hypothetical protein
LAKILRLKPEPGNLARISTVKVRGFRGIPTELVLDFCEGSDKQPRSLLLSGDNGTGKSSFVDAIELGLQARLGKAKNLANCASQASVDSPSILVTLSDGQIVARETFLVDDLLCIRNRVPHKSFSVSPFVIRREDLVSFINAPEIDKQKFFWDYLRGTTDDEWGEPDEVVTQRLLDEKHSF